jgi:hypothetical protein
MDNAAAIARQTWTLFEPVHVVSYFTPEARAAFEQAGLRGFWRGYFAGRAAPMGQVGAPAVVAAFFVFAPAMVGRAIPGVWELATPARALAARQAGAVAAVRRLLDLKPGDPVPPAVTAASDELAAAASHLDGAGHSLAAPNLALPVPDEPVARLWHAATLVAADLDGAEALALRAGVDRAGLYQAGDGTGSHVEAGWKREQLQPARGWTDAQWDAADERLTARGLLDGERAATPAGVALHREIEHATDQAAARPWTRFGQDRVAALTQLLRPIARACATAMPFPNPVGVPAPDGPTS